MGSVCTGVVVFHRSMVDWRRGWGQSIMKLIQCRGLPEIYAQLMEGQSAQGICALCYM